MKRNRYQKHVVLFTRVINHTVTSKAIPIENNLPLCASNSPFLITFLPVSKTKGFLCNDWQTHTLRALATLTHGLLVQQTLLLPMNMFRLLYVIIPASTPLSYFIQKLSSNSQCNADYDKEHSNSIIPILR